MSAIRITQSVGLGGVNTPAYVKTVQTALNKLLKLISPLRITSSLSTEPKFVTLRFLNLENLHF